MTILAQIVGQMPEVFPFKGKQMRRLRDLHIYDTESIATGDKTKKFFTTLGTKATSQANFFGDLSLIQKDNIFVPVSIRALPRSLEFTLIEYLTFFHKGHFTWKIQGRDKVTVDEDTLESIAGGLMPRPLGRTSTAPGSSGRQRIFWGDGRHDNVRIYAVNGSKIIQGGRALDFSVNWDESAGNGLLAATDLKIEFYGVEYEPAGL